MPSFRTGVVGRVLAERRGLQKVEVRLGDGAPERAYVLTQLIGTVAEGDEVVVNTTAVELGLGTGGWHVVHWNLARREWSEPGPGSAMKLRYTSLQADTGSAEDEADGPADLCRRPVVVCSLHSQVGVVAAAYAAAGGGRLAYVMTDGGALPLAFSDLIAACVDAKLLIGTVTAGQAFGGDLEAVNVWSGLALTAARLDADAVVVGPGPGVSGTGTELGFSALDGAATLDAAQALNAETLLAVRVSDADRRARHRGVSHHSATITRMARKPAILPVPAGESRLVGGLRGRVVEVDVPDVAAVLDEAGIEVTTMGRGPTEDPAFFRWSAAAGIAAAAHG